MGRVEWNGLLDHGESPCVGIEDPPFFAAKQKKWRHIIMDPNFRTTS